MTEETRAKPDLSVVIPMHNESENAASLTGEVAAALNQIAFELILVDDKSTDQTLEKLVALKAEFPMLRVLSHETNAGQSRAIRSGILAARAPIIATLDGDGQNDPADLPDMYNQLTRNDAPEKLSLVQGVRAKRQDTAWKKFGSRLANNVRQSILKDNHPDSGCGAKVFRRDAFLLLPYFDHMHRYMPALMQAEGFEIEAAPVKHRERSHGQSKYTNFGRLAVAWSDLNGVLWLRKRRRRTGSVTEM